jgi:two-component system NtrC family sensor kinase
LLDLKAADLRRHRITVSRQFAGNLPSLPADVNRLEQVFLNLINNAQQAMAEWEGERLLTVTTLAAADRLRIHFKDSGPGIEQANIQKIFEPFFTTKEIGKGTGLGLSICYDIIQDHGGRIYLASEPGKGADFIIELPLPSPLAP